MATNAQRNAIKTYKEKLDFIQLSLPKDGTKDRYKASAAAAGKSLNAYIIDLIEQDITAHATEK